MKKFQFIRKEKCASEPKELQRKRKEILSDMQYPGMPNGGFPYLSQHALQQTGKSRSRSRSRKSMTANNEVKDANLFKAQNLLQHQWRGRDYAADDIVGSQYFEEQVLALPVKTRPDSIMEILHGRLENIVEDHGYAKYS